MKTITIYLESDLDAARIMKALHNTPFEETVEAYEMDEAISERKLDAFEQRLDDYHKKPYTEDGYVKFRNEMQEKYDVGVLIKLK